MDICARERPGVCTVGPEHTVCCWLAQKNAAGGARELCCFTGSESDGFHCQVIDSGAGAANVLHDTVDGREVLLAANREIGEVALYTAAG